VAEVGVNPNKAVTTGGEAGTIAASFRGLGEMFRSTVDLAWLRSVENPIRSGYLAFAEERMSAIAKVQAHGEALSGNIEAGGADGARTDSAIDQDMQGVRELLLRDLNYELVRE
jgi:hypothetical protein